MRPIAPGLGYGTGDRGAKGERTNAQVFQDELLMRVKTAADQIVAERTNDPELEPGVVVLVVRRPEYWVFEATALEAFDRISEYVADTSAIDCVVMTYQANGPLHVRPSERAGRILLLAD